MMAEETQKADGQVAGVRKSETCRTTKLELNNLFNPASQDRKSSRCVNYTLSISEQICF